MTLLRRLACVATLALGPALAGMAAADPAGDLVFAERGPWKIEGEGPVWTLNIAGPEVQGQGQDGQNFRKISDGRLRMEQSIDPSDGKPVLHLVETNAGHDRKIGPFPSDSGDPSVIFFLETVARDMAAITGGSPFYIRNRMKDSVFRGGEIRTENGQQVAVFRPFAQDPNKERMGAFSELELSFVITDPKQPIHSMIASTGGETPLFRLAMMQP